MLLTSKGGRNLFFRRKTILVRTTMFVNLLLKIFSPTPPQAYILVYTHANKKKVTPILLKISIDMNMLVISCMTATFINTYHEQFAHAEKKHGYTFGTPPPFPPHTHPVECVAIVQLAGVSESGNVAAGK